MREYMRRGKLGRLFLGVVMLTGLWAAPSALADEPPRYGGILRVALAGDPPSLDMHQEGTFKVKIPLSPCYNTLIVYDPHGYPNIIGDLAKSWTISDDGLTYTFKLHQGVKFHDGSEMTSADVKASWEHFVFPSQGVVSPRRSLYQAIKRISAPDRDTVVFHLKYPSASFLSMVAYPHAFIYAKKYLDQDPHWYKQHVMGTGPFKLKKYVRGSYLEVERNPDYFKKGLPYMDGIKYFMIKDLSARAKSVRSGRTDTELRGLPPAEVEALKKQMGDKIVIRYPKAMIHWGVAFNVDEKPFNDVRVRKAMSLAIDRYEMAKILGPLSGLETVGGLMHPDSQWALTPEELQALPGFGTDHEANVKEAKRLLAAAGYPNGFQTVLSNRAVKLPYIDFGVYLISSWKKIGVEAKHQLEESATWYKSLRTRNFKVMVNPFGSSGGGDPDQMMVRYLTGASPNWSRISDPEFDKLFEQQKVERDEQKRIALVQEMQKVIMRQVWWMPVMWWTRIEVRSAHIRNYEPHHSHHMNRRFEDVWLAAK
jgi:peptide/nickel transport system substrate-binding protein